MGDRLSSLPDEILPRILGFSPMRDAVATGLLSRRWRNLWKSVSVFKFNPLSQHGVYKRDTITQKKNVKQWRMKNYAYWVDWVIGQLQQLKSFEEFWICYQNSWKGCAFPPPYLREEKASSVIQLCLKGVEVPSSPGFSIFSSLTSLTLSCVTLYHCDELNDVEIYAPNLVSFTYATVVKTGIAFESVPKLVKACFSARHVQFGLEINAMEAEARSPVLSPTFMSLKTLALFVDTIDDIMKCKGLPCLLVEACPMLQKFDLHQSRQNDVVELESSEELKASLSTHRFLKEIFLRVCIRGEAVKYCYNSKSEEEIQNASCKRALHGVAPRYGSSNYFLNYQI
ncbi:hypothetical protein COLO4_05213 [Corchorus olitorius]|uniref:F-box domain-containing protein n=1 Tax=Corchorus olitorius TaxID=93759 RepID=A0A1R3KRI8_9ROSI|nr:hypothetical protein COLO4_05213 [Corchorus olitorius]